MDRTRFKEQVYLGLVLVQKHPFITLFLLILSTPPFLKVAIFLAAVFISTAVCVISLVSLGPQIENMRAEREMKVERVRENAERTLPVLATDGALPRGADFSPMSGTTRPRRSNAGKWADWVRGFQGKPESVLYAEGQFIHDIEEEGVKEDGGITKVNEDYRQSSALKLSEVDKNILGGSIDKKISELCVSSRSQTQQSLGNGLQRENEGTLVHSPLEDDTDLPELEECSSSGEEEAICKAVVESTVAVHGAGVGSVEDCEEIGILEPNSEDVDRHKYLPCQEDDETAVDKHQILPPEAGETMRRSESNKTPEPLGISVADPQKHVPMPGTCELTDDELQIVAGDFYTLEGDILWQESDLRKQQDTGKRLEIDGIPSELSKQCEIHEEEDDFSADDYTIFPNMMQSETGQVSSLPLNIPWSQAGSGPGVLKSEENRAPTREINEDALIDQKLREIALRTKDPHLVSCLKDDDASDRKLVSPSLVVTGREQEIRELEESYMGAAHSRSRSKILQSDPLLSPDSLIREQEMDVLWQEYNEDLEQESEFSRGHKTGGIRKQEGSRWRINGEDNSIHDARSDAVGVGDQKDEIGESSRWSNWQQPGRARGLFSRRRHHLLGICRALKDLGLKQCLQSSNVKN